MFSDLILIHRPGGKSNSTLADEIASVLSRGSLSPEIFSWQTCLRQIALVSEADLDSVRPQLSRGDEVYRGEAGFRFLLQVICGLHSPLVGETEVYGQFKNTVAGYKYPATPWGTVLKRFFRSLFEDAKRVRQLHLEELGSQSYGSVLRKELKGHSRIHILGAGQFVRDILPWIAKDGIEIHIYARDVKKASVELQDVVRAEVKVHLISETTSLCGAEAVIVAAPVTAEWLKAWLSSQDLELRKVADLRADSAHDELELDPNVGILNLGDVFSRISENQAFVETRKSAALVEIEAAVYERNFHVEYRPFGWEDVCA